MKLEPGKNTFRILSDPIVGWEYWTEDGSKKVPIRVKEFKSVPSTRVHSKNPQERPSHFWAMFVWNRETEMIQVLKITQATIQGGMKAYIDEADWGDPKDYDFSITKEGEGFDTRYTVIAKPHTGLEKEVTDLWKESKKDYDLTRMFDNGNVFGDDEERVEPTGRKKSSDGDLDDILNED